MSKRKPGRSFSLLHSLKNPNIGIRQGQDPGFLLSRSLWKCMQAESGLRASLEGEAGLFSPSRLT
nr:hypothetical protein [Methanosarcina mazei]